MTGCRHYWAFWSWAFWSWAFWIWLCVVPGVLAVDDPRRAGGEGGWAATSRDLVYLDEGSPIIIRLHIQVDGEPFEARWRRHVHELFQQVDEDQDGHLTREEISQRLRAPGNSEELVQMLRNPRLWVADRQPLDQRITCDELAAFLVSRDGGPLQAPAGPTIGGSRTAYSSGGAGAALFSLIDQDSDRQLSRGELARATDSLHRRDLDDDGTYSVAELTSVSAMFRGRQPLEVGRPFVVLRRGTAPIDLLRRLWRYYGTNTGLARDLTAKDLGLDAGTFATYDADADKRLDADELRAFLRDPAPTVELLVRLGDEAGQPEFTVLGETGLSVRGSAIGLATVTIDNVQIEIDEVKDSSGRFQRTVMKQFQEADRDNNQYLDKSEATDRSGFAASFDELDGDNDGKLFADELQQILRQRAELARRRTRVAVANRGRDLFQILDSDRNGRLGRRELRRAASRIELWDRNGDDAIAEAEVPHMYQLTLGPGEPEVQGFVAGDRNSAVTPRDSATSVGGPRWFQRMDRNRDGEVIRREFPGSRSDFRHIDLNSDGVVDVSEAIQVDSGSE